MQLFRATIFHTPENPFPLDISDPAALTCLQDGGLLVDNGRVVVCGEYGAIRDAHPSAATIDWRGGFILPGLIDAHVHFPQVRIIGAMGRTLLDWLDAVALPEEARMTDRGYAAETAKLFVHALASHGTTTALVFGAHFADATAELFEAASASGLRIASGMVLSDRLLRPELHVGAEQAYRDSTTLIERYHKRGRLRYAVTPRFAYSTTESMLEVCQQLMSDHPDVLLQTHINENSTEIESSRACSHGRVTISRFTSGTNSAARDQSWRTTSTPPHLRLPDSPTRVLPSLIVQAATLRSAAAVFRCGAISMPV